MVEQVYSNPDIFKIFVPLPDNPLQNLNSYFIKAGDKGLLIDTGFNRSECEKALREGIEELGLKMENVDLYLTHLHSDHVGLAATLMPKTSKIYMGRVDYEYLLSSITGDHWEKMDEMFFANGFPEEKILELHTKNPARIFGVSGTFDAVTLEDGDKFKIGDIEFTCIVVPGHTPGNTCLYIEKEKLMFLGDHVLFDITPNITAWNGVKDSLGQYIESLGKIEKYEMNTWFPAHRNSRNTDVYERIAALKVHHKDRLQNTVDVVGENPDSSAYEIAAYMKWQMRGRNWEEFPVSQRWFAVGETVAHLNYLEARDLVTSYVDEKGVNRYKLV